MTRYDKIKSLIDKFDPDARPAVPAAAMIMAGEAAVSAAGSLCRMSIQAEVE
jgi:hypothetical protein